MDLYLPIELHVTTEDVCAVCQCLTLTSMNAIVVRPHNAHELARLDIDAAVVSVGETAEVMLEFIHHLLSHAPKIRRVRVHALSPEERFASEHVKDVSAIFGTWHEFA